MGWCMKTQWAESIQRKFVFCSISGTGKAVFLEAEAIHGQLECAYEQCDKCIFLTFCTFEINDWGLAPFLLIVLKWMCDFWNGKIKVDICFVLQSLGPLISGLEDKQESEVKATQVKDPPTYQEALRQLGRTARAEVQPTPTLLRVAEPVLDQLLQSGPSVQKEAYDTPLGHSVRTMVLTGLSDTQYLKYGDKVALFALQTTLRDLFNIFFRAKQEMSNLKWENRELKEENKDLHVQLTKLNAETTPKPTKQASLSGFDDNERILSMPAQELDQGNLPTPAEAHISPGFQPSCDMIDKPHLRSVATKLPTEDSSSPTNFLAVPTETKSGVPGSSQPSKGKCVQKHSGLLKSRSKFVTQELDVSNPSKILREKGVPIAEAGDQCFMRSILDNLQKQDPEKPITVIKACLKHPILGKVHYNTTWQELKSLDFAFKHCYKENFFEITLSKLNQKERSQKIAKGAFVLKQKYKKFLEDCQVHSAYQGTWSGQGSSLFKSSSNHVDQHTCFRSLIVFMQWPQGTCPSWESSSWHLPTTMIN